MHHHRRDVATLSFADAADAAGSAAAWREVPGVKTAREVGAISVDTLRSRQPAANQAALLQRSLYENDPEEEKLTHHISHMLQTNEPFERVADNTQKLSTDDDAREN